MSAVELLRSLVRIPSVSGEEEACRDFLAQWLEDHGVRAWTSGRNVLGLVEGSNPEGRGLLLLTHIDVVPVGPGWTREPWDGALVNGRVMGRGANDAKASVASMAWAAAHLARTDFDGRLVLAFVCDEETGGEGIEACGGELPAFDASVVGEPTELDVCPGQRGLLRASIVARGRSCHASRPWEGVNAIELAARDVLAVQALTLGGDDELLGPATLQCTVIQGGTRPNVLPGECTIELDGRPAPGCDNDALRALLEGAVQGEVTVRSNRFLPVRTPVEEPIVRAALAASPTGRVRGFGGVSDLFHVRHKPGVVMGPGTSAASHAPDEWVEATQIESAVHVYQAIARAYLAPEA
ncbi:MAG: M20 family metallopeptidase [Planctomycetota bacterium]|nr:M20 family metallopeptidase [Planctomycetota bacterium]